MKVVQTNLKFRSALTPLNLDGISAIVLHHIAAKTATVEQIHAWHLERDNRAWAGIGYNEYIRKDGTVYIGRGDNVGAHTKNINSRTYGISVEGDYDTEKEMPKVQFDAVVERVRFNKARFKNLIEVAPHKKFATTACPGKYYPLEEILKAIEVQPKAKPVERVLKQGSVGDDVKDLQQKLKNLGYVMAIDGIFGPGTKKGVVEFQKLNGLVPDGIVGAMTRARLAIAKPIPYQVLQYNKYIRIIKMRKTSILKSDVVDSIGAKETVKSMFARVKPTIMISGGMFGMINGKSLSKFFDGGKKITDGIYSNFSFIVDKLGKPGFKYLLLGDPVENDALGASPSLIINGKKVIDKRGLEKDYAFLNTRHPRLAIGEDKDYIYIVRVHGRKLWLGYRGMTIDELANLGVVLELVNYMNIDGGGTAIVLGPDGKPLDDPLENRAVDNGIAFWLEV